MALSQREKVDIRRHLDVAFAGVPSQDYALGIRTFTRAGQLEYYMNNLQTTEESVLTGRPFGSIRLYGVATAGAVINMGVQLAGASSPTPITYTVTSTDVTSPLPLQTIALNAANVINSTPGLGVVGSGGQFIAGTPPQSGPNFSEIMFLAQGFTTFTISVSITSGPTTFSAAIIDNGDVYPNPQVSFQNPDGTTTSYYGYLPICNFLEGEIAISSQDLSLVSAGGLSTQAAARFRPDQIDQRYALYRLYCQRLGKVMSTGIISYGYPHGGAMGQSIGIVV